jgi:hypothetical protein
MGTQAKVFTADESESETMPVNTSSIMKLFAALVIVSCLRIGVRSKECPARQWNRRRPFLTAPVPDHD